MLDDQMLADVVYRADRLDRTEATVRLRMPAAAATAADGWARLTQAHGPIDPRSIEIEIREAALA